MRRDEQSYGPFVAHTTPTSARLWLRAGAALRGADRAVVARLFDAGGERCIEERRFAFVADFDHVGLVEFGGEVPLSPDTVYRYRVELDASAAGTQPAGIASGEFRTFSDRPDRLVSFVTGSCRHLYTGVGPLLTWIRNGFRPLHYGDQAFATIRRRAARGLDGDALPDFMLMTGDQVYADHEEGAFVPPWITKHAFTLDEYRDNYYRAYVQPNFAWLGGRMPMYMTMDDHEIANDWRMDEIEVSARNDAKRAGRQLCHYRGGLSAYLSYQAALSSVIERPSELAAELAARNDTAYETGAAMHSDAPYRDHSKGLHYTFAHGPARFFCMDVRTERYARAGQIAGECQMRALYRWLDAQDPDAVKFVVTSVPIFPDTQRSFAAAHDKWGGFAAQRTRLLAYLCERDRPIRKVVFVSGDVHVSFAGRLEHRGRDTGVYAIVSSAFTWPVPGLQAENFAWGPLAERSVEKHGKWVPDPDSAGDYRSIPLQGNPAALPPHARHNFCRVETDGTTLRVRFLAATDGKLLDDIRVDLNTGRVGN